MIFGRILLQRQIDKAKKNGRDIDWDEAYEEVIADSCESFLRDSNAVEKIAELNLKDAGLAQKIKQFIKNMLKSLRELMNGVNPETYEGKIVSDMESSLQKLYDLWTDALIDAGEAYSGGVSVADSSGSVKEHADNDVLYSERMKKVDDTVDKAIKQKGNLGVKYNQERISEVPADISAIVDAASDGRINLIGKYVAINGSDIWHEFERHTDVENETGRRQIPLTAETIKEAVMAIYKPDVVESLFSTSQNPTQRQSFAYAKKSPNGYYIVVEAVGGKTNPNVVPVEILQFSEAKWDEMISKGKTLGELLFENDTKKRNSLDVAFNKKNRVIVAQFASKEAIANTPHSPRFTNSIPQPDDSVNRGTEKNSLRNVEPIETDDYVKMYHYFGSTKNYDVAGYMLGNGMMLDFSGKHWGDDYSTSRQVDHRDIQEVLDNRGNNGVNAMVDMIGDGNIRLMPEVGGINLAVKPNATQMSQLRGYINHFKGEVTIDIDEVGGDTIHSFSYTRGTSSAKVLADIKAYFDEGIVPEQNENGETDIRQFLYSDRDADALTNREILANTLESAAQTEREKLMLEKYKAKLADIEIDQTELDRTNAELRELYFATGKRNTARIEALEARKDKLQKRINNADSWLLKYDAMKPIKDLVQREKAAAYKQKADPQKESLLFKNIYL